MYLKKLEMKGFKSFADRTVLDFNDGVTCVVGPNGSGKSNITDAVRWVLGEQKVKTLRGAKMEDIIFSGTSHRSSLGLAEVSLHFDNESRFFPLDYSEIIITRRIYRSGESEYLLNGTACRLKDVRELFMDTGIGTDGYSIIGQGKIESILSSNGDDRRQVFEEAAGIVKYKAKKREATRKLENTELNLLRIEDIAHELKGRIEPLQRESERAKIYISLSDELKDLEINLFLNELSKVDQKLGNVTGLFAEKQAAQLDSKEVHDKLQESIHAQEATLFDVENAVGVCNEKYVGISDAFRIADGDLSLTDEKLRNANTDLTRFETEMKHWASEGEKTTLEIAEAEQTYQLIVNDLKALQAASEAEEKNYLELSQALVELGKTNETSREKIIENLNLIERHKSDSRNLEDNAKRFENRLADLHKDIEADVEAQGLLQESCDEAQGRVDSHLAHSQSIEGELVEIRAAISEVQSKNQQAVDSLQKGKLSEEKTKTELNVLKAMEASMEGFDYSVKTLMGWIQKNQKTKGLIGVVADLIEIPSEMETAIDIALGKGLQNVICQDNEAVKVYIQALKQERMGRVTFLPLSNLNEQKNDVSKEILGLAGYMGVASDLIKFPSEITAAMQYLLGRTLIFRTYDEAVHALKVKSNRMRVVTLEGELLIPGGAITGGSVKQKTTGVLNRKTKISQLESDLEAHKIHLSAIENHLETLKEEIEQLSTELTDKETSYRNSMDAYRHAEMILRELGNQKKQYEEKSARYEREIEDLKDELRRIEDKKQWIVEQLSISNKMIEELESTMRVGDEKRSNLSEAFQKAGDKKTALAVRMAGETERHESFKRDLDRLKFVLNQSAKEIEQRKAAIEQVNILKRELIVQKEELIVQKSQWQEELTAIKAELGELSEDKEAMRQELSRQNESLMTCTVALDRLNNELHALEIDLTKYTVEKENVVRTIEERYEMSVEEAAGLKKEIDEKIVNQRTRQIKSQLKELGEVNTGSIKEYEEVTERYGFMKEQMDDLIKGQQTLKKIIKELDVTMKKQFVETFENIRSNFGDVFRALFNGGTADLKIVDEENVLESDIEIFAQPPGKRLQNLTLLSGGEKSLTAIALLFSTLKYKPAPFCMLDEIEAALDDVNVYRFAEFLKDFSDTSQFVIITHRKGTMEIADILYGVTMEEYGVSKIVSVKMEDVQL